MLRPFIVILISFGGGLIMRAYNQIPTNSGYFIPSQPLSRTIICLLFLVEIRQSKAA